MQVQVHTSQPPTRAPGTCPSTPTPSTPTPPPEDTTVLSRVMSKAAGIGFGIAGAAVHGAAGGAAGLTHGANIEGVTGERSFFGVFAANLVAGGVITAALAHGGATGIATAAAGALVSGIITWSLESPTTQQEVKNTAAEWTDKVMGGMPTLKDDGAKPGITRRVTGGVVGEVVGYVAGSVAGAKSYYERGKAFGERAYHSVNASFERMREK